MLTASPASFEIEGGAIRKREYRGLRSLAYRIKKNRKGHETLVELDANARFVSEMEPQLRRRDRSPQETLTLRDLGVIAVPETRERV